MKTLYWGKQQVHLIAVVTHIESGQVCGIAVQVEKAEQLVGTFAPNIFRVECFDPFGESLGREMAKAANLI